MVCIYCPTKFNPADDPSRAVPLRLPCPLLRAALAPLLRPERARHCLCFAHRLRPPVWCLRCSKVQAGSQYLLAWLAQELNWVSTLMVQRAAIGNRKT